MKHEQEEAVVAGSESLSNVYCNEQTVVVWVSAPSADDVALLQAPASAKHEDDLSFPCHSLISIEVL